MPTIKNHEETDGKVGTTVVPTDKFGEVDVKTLLPTAFGGHCYYVRQDITGEQVGDDFMEREIGGIALPDRFIDRSQYVTVLAIGPNVGKKPTKAHREKYDWPKGVPAMSEAISVGDRLLINLRVVEYTAKIKRSPWNWDCELFIEESLPEAIVG